MHYVLLICVASFLARHQVLGKDGFTYRAVVVEYSPVLNTSIDAETNILNNVFNYVDIIEKAASGEIMADIIVFPEVGLKGYKNKEFPVEVPDPANKIKPCTTLTDYQPPLVQLSCAAAATNTYVVVNLAEKFHHDNEDTDSVYNTNVVFDPNGVVIARYRKINLYNEGNKEPSPDGELVYFDTDFGVRFGLFTCFDIIFKTPGLDLARQYNVSHFIFTAGWFQAAPFLTAIQEQSYWSYTQNAVLLASGYNMPSYGSSGSGIYFGRQGAPVYSMKDSRGSFLLAAYVPKALSVNDNDINLTANIIHKKLELPNTPDMINGNVTTEKLYLKRDYLEVYSTEPLVPTSSAERSANTSSNDATINFPLVIEKVICQGSLCCGFSLNITSVYSTTSEPITRGDDYSQLYYRLAVFDGVRNYDGAATGGVQTCAIIPCVNNSLNSCALRSDDASATPSIFSGYTQTSFIFNSIKISGNFSNENSFVGPNLFVTGEEDNYGALLSPSEIFFSSTNSTDDVTVSAVFQSKQPIDSLVTAAVYARLFSRDGEPYTGYKPDSKSAGFRNNLDFVLLVSALILLKHCYSIRNVSNCV